METLVDVVRAEGSGEAPALADWPTPPFLAHPAVLAGVGVAVLAVVTPLATQLQGAVAPAIFQTCTIFCLRFGTRVFYKQPFYNQLGSISRKIKQLLSNC